jgi:hypothetical protein
MSEFDSLGGFAAHLLTMVEKQVDAQTAALDKGAAIVQKAAIAKFGQYQAEAGEFVAWAELADATKEDRVRQGYPEDEPGLRSGETRDSIQRTAGPAEAHIGSDKDELVWFELGTPTQPPRSVLGAAAVEQGERVSHVIGQSLFTALVGKEVLGGLLPLNGQP